MNKRDFLKTVGASFAAVATLRPDELARRDDFWDGIRRQFILTPDYVNLENGYFLMQAQPVLESFIDHVRAINLEASHYMRTRQYDDKRAVAARIAGLLGAAPEEVIITRNTTESLDTIIHAFDWHAGDEAVMAEQDYGAMLDMFRLQARRYGIVNKVVSLPHDPRSDDEIVNLYESQITPRTRLLMVCHMVNITGQILPVAKITAMAHRHDVPVMVDGAHAFAHLDFRIGDLGGCDFYGSSLHKWLGTPLGAGMLYVRRDRIPSLWPIFADLSMHDDDIRKLNHTGTHPVWTDLAINDAIAFHETVGIARKEARMRHLQRYWTDKVRGRPGITLNTPTDPARSCGIANVGVDRLQPGDLARTLLERYRIWTVAIDGAGVHGVRICPHLFTTTSELDLLVNSLTSLAAG